VTDTTRPTAGSPTTVQAFIVNPNTTGTLTPITPDLAGIQQHLNDGWAEHISPNAGTIPWHAYIDEEGKIKRLPVNAFATILARHLGWHSNDVLCGPVIFLGDHPEGLESDVPDILVALAARLATPTPEDQNTP
jgi:hypothetical protein